MCQESDDFQNDRSSITHQQRYVWNKLLNLPIGHEGSPPTEVRETYTNAPPPKIRAVIVNHFVPKNVRYRDVIKFNQGRLHKFLERFVEHKESIRAEGYTFTELRSILGYGNLENGTIALEEGLACGDIQKKAKNTTWRDTLSPRRNIGEKAMVLIHLPKMLIMKSGRKLLQS